MPTVPYSPIPQQGPADVPIPFRTDTGATPIAFGAGIGEAKERLAGQIEKAGDVMAQQALSRQDLANRAETDKADAQFMEQAGAEHAKFGAMQGADAAKYYPTYVQNLKNIRENIRGGLSNPMSQKMFDSQSLSTLGRTIFNGAGHAATEQHQDAIQSVEGRMNAQRNYTAALQDPQAIEEGKQKIRDLSVTRDHLRGISDPVAIEGNARTATSSLDRDYLEHMAKSDPWGADEEFKKRAPGMTEQDQRHIRDVIDNQETSTGATGIANDVMVANQNQDGEVKASFKDLEQQAREKARKMSPGDPKLEQHVVQQLRTQYNLKKYGDRDEAATNINTIHTLIAEGGANSTQEILANPDGYRAYQGLGSLQKATIDQKINGWVAARDQHHNDQMMAQFAGLRKNAHDEFILADPFDPRYNLSQQNIKTILNQQRSDLQQRPHDDPRPWAAMHLLQYSMGTQLRELGLDKRSGNEENYDRFTGNLVQALDAWKETHNDRPPSSKDIQEIIGPSLIKQMDVPGRFWGTNKEFVIGQPPTEKFTKDFMRDNPKATTEELQREYTRGVLKEYYSGKTSSTATPAQKVEQRFGGFQRPSPQQPKTIPAAREERL